MVLLWKLQNRSVPRALHRTLRAADRALGGLQELDDTVRETVKKLKELRILDETLIVVSARHGHGLE